MSRIRSRGARLSLRGDRSSKATEAEAEGPEADATVELYIVT